MLERWSAGGRGSVEQQVQGGVESLDPFRADRIFALDERLTRQFGKTLAMIGVEKVKLQGIAADAFQQTLIYSGKVGDKINIGYREFSSNVARPAFNNDVEYDLKDSTTIGYKGALIEVLEATNQSIRYRVIRNFNAVE